MTELKLSNFIGDGLRGDGFEDFTAVAGAAIGLFDNADDPQQAALLRMMKLFLIAAVEGANSTSGSLCREDQLSIMPAAAGYACFCAVASLMKQGDLEDARITEGVFRLFQDGFRRGLVEAKASMVWGPR
jgi:hypothetical protein